MLAIDLPHARRLAFGVVLAPGGGQRHGGARVPGALADRRAALSALLGGGIATLGSLVMAGLVFGGGRLMDPQRVLGTFYLGEAVKVVVVIVLFVLVLKWVNVAPLAMFVAFAATFLVYWIALVARAADPGRRAPRRLSDGRIGTGMADAEQAPGATEYILHHQTFLSNKAPHGIVDFSVINYDTVFFSVALAVVFFGLFWLVGPQGHLRACPGKLQNFVEMIVGFVDTQVKRHLPRHQPPDRPAGADHLLLGVPVQLHGPGAGGPAAVGRARRRP